MDVNSSHAKTVVYVRATMEDSDAFAPLRAKTGSCMVDRIAQLRLQAVMRTSVRMEECVLPYL